MLAHFCSSWWRLESSESRLPNSEESPHLPLRPHVQLVEEHPSQLSADQAPAISYKSPAPRSITGWEKPPLRVRGAGRGEAVEDQRGEACGRWGPRGGACVRRGPGRGPREAGSEGGLIAGKLAVELGTWLRCPGTWVGFPPSKNGKAVEDLLAALPGEESSASYKGG